MVADADPKPESSAKQTISAKQARKGKKRKRVKQSPEEMYQVEGTDRYNKLHHACSKHLHKEAKIVKSFECQKIVRAIKALNDSSGVEAAAKDDGDGDKEKKEIKNASKASKRGQTLRQKLERTKKMELDALVQIGLKRLGVLNLDPRLNEDDALDDDGAAAESSSPEKPQTLKSQQTNHSDTKPSPQNEDKFYQTLFESMLRHKRLSAALDQLNEKVSDHRRWKTHRESILRGEISPDDRGNKKGKKKKRGQDKSSDGNDTMVVAGGYNSKKRGLNLGGHEGESGLFIGSLSGMMPVEGYGDHGDDEYGDENEYDGEEVEYQQEKKKNRPGQRARRAKAIAIEARNAGKTWDSSINWREKKMDRNENARDGGQRSAKPDGRGRRGGHNSTGDIGKPSASGGGAKSGKAQHIATTGKTWKEEGNAHPSWAAAAAQKSQGIAKFKGKKITFD